MWVMRPKLIALLAVPALALVGCGGTEQTQTVPVEPSPSTSDTPTKAPVAKKTAAPSFSEVEENFIVFAETRAELLGIKDLPSDKKLVQQFNDFCDSGKRIKISKVADLNKNMEITSESTFCEMRD